VTTGSPPGGGDSGSWLPSLPPQPPSATTIPAKAATITARSLRELSTLQPFQIDESAVNSASGYGPWGLTNVAIRSPPAGTQAHPQHTATCTLGTEWLGQMADERLLLGGDGSTPARAVACNAAAVQSATRPANANAPARPCGFSSRPAPRRVCPAAFASEAPRGLVAAGSCARGSDVHPERGRRAALPRRRPLSSQPSACRRVRL